MLFVDDLRIVVVLQRPLPIKSNDIFFHLFDEFLVDALVSQHIVRRYAGLTCIEEFAPDDPSSIT